jgi:hypothetical protein
MLLDKLVDALTSGGNNITKVRVFINPSFHKPLLIEIKPCLYNITNLSEIDWDVALFELIKIIFKHILGA